MNAINQPSIELLRKLEPLPLGCEASLLRSGNGWVVSISAVYGGFVWYEHEFLPDALVGWVSALRDKMLTRHWRRARDLAEYPYEVGALYWCLYPYSKMEQLNHAAF